MSANEHIEKYLGHYLQIGNPGFAVLLKGEWGCGKTWFIKNFIENGDKDKKMEIKIKSVFYILVCTE